MLRLNVKFNAGEATRTVDLIFRQASDVKPVLRRWIGWMRADAREHFEQQPGWPGLAQSTMDRLKATRTSNVTVRGKVRASYARKAAQGFTAKLRRRVVNSSTHLAELRRLAAGGSASYSLQDGQRRQSVALERLRKNLLKSSGGKVRVGGDKRKADKHKILDKLRGSLVADTKETSVALESRVPWAGVHNQGGTAGKGAQIPKRTFLEIDERSAAMLAQIALEHLMGQGH